MYSHICYYEVLSIISENIFYCVKLQLSVKQNPVIPNINSGANDILYII